MKNIAVGDRYIKVTGNYDLSSLAWQLDDLLLWSGQVVTFRGNFTMPNEPVTVAIRSWWWQNPQWVEDDVTFKTINLATLSPVFADLRILDFRKV